MVVTVVLIGCVVAALITAKPASATERPSALSRAAGDASGAPPLVVGLGFALGRGRRRAVPAWTAIVATTIGVLGVVGAVVVFASLDRLATTPSRYGWTWGVVLDGYGGADVCPASDPIAEDPAIDAVASYCYQNLTVAGRPTIGFTLRDIRGGIRPVAVEGRLPRNAGEVALGRDVLNDVGRSIGDQVVLRGAGDADRGNHRFTVVGTTLSPGLGDAQSLAGGALFTFAGLQRAALLDPTNDYMVATLDPAHDGPAARRRLEQRNGGLPLLHATVPAEIDRLRQIDGLPLVIAAVMALVGTVAVAYTLVVSVRRRRRDLAVLKTMGFTRRQVRETVAWQATVLCGVGVLAGIALGLLAGKFMWRAIANDLGVSTAIAVPVLAIAVLVPLALVLANLVAAVPGGTAARTPPAVVLRTE